MRKPYRFYEANIILQCTKRVQTVSIVPSKKKKGVQSTITVTVSSRLHYHGRGHLMTTLIFGEPFSEHFIRFRGNKLSAMIQTILFTETKQLANASI